MIDQGVTITITDGQVTSSPSATQNDIIRTTNTLEDKYIIIRKQSSLGHRRIRQSVIFVNSRQNSSCFTLIYHGAITLVSTNVDLLCFTL